MASRKANAAVEAYRKLVRKQTDAEDAFDELSAKIIKLSSDEFDDYMQMTREIDKAMDKIEETADESNWATSTRRQQRRLALNNAGLDHEPA